MTNSELFQILRPHIMTVTGVPECILADPNGPSPSGEYASVRPRQGIRERGQANIYTSDRPGNLVRTEVRAQIIADCEINFYRGNALQRAESLKECHKRPDVARQGLQQQIVMSDRSHSELSPKHSKYC